MDQKSLISFLVLAEELQFSRAASRLGLTQSALSQQIARLEKELGVALFERTKRSVRLSDCGQVFLSDAQDVITQIDKAVETARRAAKGQLGKLTIAYVDAAPFSILSPLLIAFRRQYPDVRISLHEMTSGEQFSALQQGKIDVGLLRPMFDADWLRSATLLRETYVIAMWREHDLAAFDEVDFRQLNNEKFIFTSIEKARYINSKFMPIFKRHGMFPIIVQEVNQLHALLSLVGAGMGLALIPLSVARNNNHGVIYRNIAGMESPYAELDIAWRDDNNKTLVKNFIRIARGISSSLENPYPA
ncbi:LysR substrate-binding domain-containing protein [Martelella alba]|uniref:LysR family transcriptional regulator n=1 Tax=Martelella alba TaxID=2590451 RepID=A0ABY2SJ83_9HYPH|nr:LysR substrate-binding domain-containing protein [Martelella alba]TKI05517.1 LysR family transcriptional regulator [Martelella alba]